VTERRTSAADARARILGGEGRVGAGVGNRLRSTERSIALAIEAAARANAVLASGPRRSTSTDGEPLTVSLIRQTVLAFPRWFETSSMRTEARSMCVANLLRRRPRTARAVRPKP
jgi:hypothetical protein